MSKERFGHRHFVRGLDPVADAFSGTVYSDVVNLEEYSLAEFIVHRAVGATGTSALTIEACDDAAGTNPVAVAFEYQRYAGATGSDDVPGDVTAATAAGFTTTAGSSQLYVLAVPSDRLPSGKSWVRLKAAEVVDAAVLGSILIELSGPRYGRHIPNTAIA